MDVHAGGADPLEVGAGAEADERGTRAIERKYRLNGDHVGERWIRLLLARHATRRERCECAGQTERHHAVARAGELIDVRLQC